jgi:hyaluronan synthase
MTPFTQFFALIYIFLMAANSLWLLAAVGVVWLFLGRLIRSISHLYEHPEDIWLLPLLTVVVITIALPIKIWALLTMNRHGWLTRRTTSKGGDGQTEDSLSMA